VRCVIAGINLKIKSSLCLTKRQAMTYWEIGGIFPCILKLGIKRVVSFTPRSLYCRGRSPHTIGCWVGYRAGLTRWREKSTIVPTGNWYPVVQPLLTELHQVCGCWERILKSAMTASSSLFSATSLHGFMKLHSKRFTIQWKEPLSLTIHYTYMTLNVILAAMPWSLRACFM